MNFSPSTCKRGVLAFWARRTGQPKENQHRSVMGSREWQWVDDNVRWQSFQSDACQAIERAYADQEPFVILSLLGNDSPSHTVEFTRKSPMQYNMQTGAQREVRRDSTGTWEWWDGRWKSYPNDIQFKIEQAWLQSGPSAPRRLSSAPEPASLQFKIKGTMYRLFFESDGVQINLTTGGRRLVRRCSLEPPQIRSAPSASGFELGMFYEPTAFVKVTEPPEDEVCAICLEGLVGGAAESPDSIVKLSKCSHVYHRECITESMRHMARCPICKVVYGIMTGTQPIIGSMGVDFRSFSVQGYPDCGTIVITYSFPSGIQGSEHPQPGRHYIGTMRVAYLPDNAEGKEILALLKIAWERRLVFSVGRSATTGIDGSIIWAIHHKTMPCGGPANHGYPDEGYLARAREELARQGVV
eukprot:TRINITY_DN233_c1_g8_i1.p1 TRINITY_DN233_c1_g8~~TRINITY_DN233_c1_g8_i1.p1  ORF type:complete len:412 (+),score=42.49 TRINITY_DN233_c1_g8_i1:113-1348(+)